MIDVEDVCFFVALGYASPCEIQWERRDTRSTPEENGYYVTRSIIPYGFWQAWKWWEGAKYWYFEKLPELFEDSKMWGESDEPAPKPWDAVLGGGKKLNL